MFFLLSSEWCIGCMWSNSYAYVAVKSHSVLVKHLKLKPSHEDFELKKLLLNVLVLLTRDPTVLPVSFV